MTHGQLWAAIDDVAYRRGLTPSGLARQCRLDATTFNKSKRVSPYGQPRWPSVETLLRVIDASGMSVQEFFIYYDM